MKIAGSPGRMELHPESDEEREFLQHMLDVGREALLFWGDADDGGGAFIVSNTPIGRQAFMFGGKWYTPLVGASGGQQGTPAEQSAKATSVAEGA